MHAGDLVNLDETELAGIVRDWLKHGPWEVYQEVPNARYERGRIDLYAVRDDRICIAIEVKRRLGLTALRQANRWIGNAHMTFVATTPVKRNRYADPTRDFTYELCEKMGIGVLLVGRKPAKENRFDPDSTPGSLFSRIDRWGRDKTEPRFEIEERVPPRIVRRIARPDLHDGMKDMAEAGNAEGQYWTPFQQSVRNLKRYLEDRGWVRMQEAIEMTDHHYKHAKSAKSAISKGIRSGYIDGIETRMNGRYKEFKLAEDG